MTKELKRKSLTKIILLGDILIFWVSLGLTLLFRYKGNNFRVMYIEHLLPFFFIMILILIIFYTINLYSHTSLKKNIRNKKIYLMAIIIGSMLSLGFFYLFGKYFSVTPKTNFFIFILIFMILDYTSRYFFTSYLIKHRQNNKILLVANSLTAEEIFNYISNNPELGFTIIKYKKENGDLLEILDKNKCNSIIVGNDYLSNQKTLEEIYALVPKHIEIISLIDFYENLFLKVPLSEIKEDWFINKIKSNSSNIIQLYSIINIIFSFIIIILISPILIIVSIIILLTSKGKIFYKQIRIGQDDKPFMLYKFRTMHSSIEKNPDANGQNPTWCTTNDNRITKVGKVFRFTHIDELPQLFNILKGELSFVGPRPERPEFVEKLKKEIPHYIFRHIAKPGITGWAQIKFRYARTILDSKEKFEYDLYYIKNKNILLDLSIILKTIHYILSKE